MEIRWIGHACFLIKNSVGTKLLTDPFDKSVGYKIYEDDTDLVTISHHHRDHDYAESVKGDPIIIDKIGTYNILDIDFRGIQSFHDKNKGAERGQNIIFVFNIDGYKVCHLGDIGYELSDKEIKDIGEVDILMIPVGGKYTIDSKEAYRVALSLNSHYIIPMHYKTPMLNIHLDGVEDFVSEIGNSEKVGNTLKIEGNLKGYNQVKILE